VPEQLGLEHLLHACTYIIDKPNIRVVTITCGPCCCARFDNVTMSLTCFLNMPAV
jgi:hypothetical protein